MEAIVAAGELRRQVAEIPFWWHSIDLGQGVVTPGRKTPKLLADELARCRLPPLAGRSVLDIGAWDGFYSFQAERLGAERVVALDHYAWSVDWGPDTGSKVASGARAPSHLPEDDSQRWRPEQLPGKRGFDLAREALGSSVVPVVDDFMTCDLDELGQFDVALYLGVLYHMRHPLLALERLAQVTRQVAVIETSAIWTPYSNRAYCEFFETNELGGDPTNWWAPNELALIGLCRAAGFRRVEILTRPKFARRLTSFVRTAHYRLIAHAYK